ncbi:MAG: UPF0164 family protein [Ignavibacteriales bacterium]|nr:UPF0164 family protein [Ignavibacteriales bacterium]
MKKLLITFLFLFTLASTKTLGGQRVGISTAQFLKIGVGGRASAMGDAFVAVANDVSALYWNPAGLAQAVDDEIMFSHNNWVVDIGHEFFGAGYHLSSNDVIGIAFSALHMEDMAVTTESKPIWNW